MFSLIFGGHVHLIMRFLGRAGQQLAEQRGNWWTATEHMAASQVYTRSFGLAVPYGLWVTCWCIAVVMLRTCSDLLFWGLVREMLQVALIVKARLHLPPEYLLEDSPIFIEQLTRRLLAEVPVEIQEFKASFLSQDCYCAIVSFVVTLLILDRIWIPA